MSNVRNELAIKKAAVAKQLNEIEQIERMLIKFPDLTLEVDRWKHERWGAKSANPLVTNINFYHGCSCCEDSPLLASCYLEVDGLKIHSDPPTFGIGHKMKYGGGELPSSNWESFMRDKKLPEIIIAKVEQYFKENDFQESDWST